MLVMRLFALSEQEPFVNVMIDKVPRQQLVVDIVASHEKIRIGQRRIFARFDFAMNPGQLVPNCPGALTTRGFEAFEDAAHAAIASRDHRLEVRFAWRLGVELDLSQPSEALSQHRHFALVNVDAQHIVAHIGEACAAHKANIACPDNGNLHLLEEFRELPDRH